MQPLSSRKVKAGSGVSRGGGQGHIGAFGSVGQFRKYLLRFTRVSSRERAVNVSKGNTLGGEGLISSSPDPREKDAQGVLPPGGQRQARRPWGLARSGGESWGRGGNVLLWHLRMC